MDIKPKPWSIFLSHLPLCRWSCWGGDETKFKYMLHHHQLQWFYDLQGVLIILQHLHVRFLPNLLNW